jgi:hypothetical protein
MDRFGFTAGYRGYRVLLCTWPLIGLGAVAAFWILLAGPSKKGDVIQFELPWWVPLFIVALLVWLVCDVARAIGTFSFSVGVSEDRILVGARSVAWTDVQKAEIRTAGGEQPAIVLYLEGDEKIGIPAAVQGLGYLKGLVQRKIQNVQVGA